MSYFKYLPGDSYVKRNIHFRVHTEFTGNASSNGIQAVECICSSDGNLRCIDSNPAMRELVRNLNIPNLVLAEGLVVPPIEFGGYQDNVVRSLGKIYELWQPYDAIVTGKVFTVPAITPAYRYSSAEFSMTETGLDWFAKLVHMEVRLRTDKDFPAWSYAMISHIIDTTDIFPSKIIAKRQLDSLVQVINPPRIEALNYAENLMSLYGPTRNKFSSPCMGLMSRIDKDFMQRVNFIVKFREPKNTTELICWTYLVLKECQSPHELESFTRLQSCRYVVSASGLSKRSGNCDRRDLFHKRMVESNPAEKFILDYIFANNMSLSNPLP